MRSLFFATSLFALLAVGACASPSPTTPMMKGMNASGHGAKHGEGENHCPMAVANTTVTSEDVDGGAALVFVTTGDIADLRARVAKHAEHHNAMHGAAGASGHMKNVPASIARVEEVDGGARMIVTPKTPEDMDALRSHVRAHAASAQAGQCPMHGDHARG